SGPAYASTFVFSSLAAVGARGDSLGNSFLGTLDELSIYNRALTTAEIRSIYNAGSLGKCALAAPPFILSQPASQAVLVGSNATFTVTAGGTAPLKYQWSFNGSALTNA